MLLKVFAQNHFFCVRAPKRGAIKFGSVAFFDAPPLAMIGADAVQLFSDQTKRVCDTGVRSSAVHTEKGIVRKIMLDITTTLLYYLMRNFNKRAGMHGKRYLGVWNRNGTIAHGG